ncbi:PEP_CTERM-anchored TLD domain-containing protein [Pseudoduganella violaceinigra]|uniref:PEP_CTERM-anchored TLD domain-containing protein n=1 Tax=Pseudoduganella violaceinigra TaxID=246602 RepID=UPI00041D20F0|nr:PEP_CTERM-anchored TLD domain-containing protein [Pseudoduganella violaceinigra]
MANLLPRLLGAAILLSLPAAHASTPLLTDADMAQLSSWLGNGPVRLERLYQKRDGETAADFHAAVDGKGRTFTVMEATNELGQMFKVGGYNPQSWASSGGFHITTEDARRTGFLFNLTSRQIHRQTPRTYALDTVGSFQTWNNATTGPVFGAGHDLYVPWDLTHGGYSIMYSYIDPVRSDFDSSLLDGRDYKSPNITYGQMEVWRVFAVPEAGMWLMLASGLCLIGLTRRWFPVASGRISLR